VTVVSNVVEDGVAIGGLGDGGDLAHRHVEPRRAAGQTILYGGGRRERRNRTSTSDAYDTSANSRPAPGS
jgi:hypothetical protein